MKKKTLILFAPILTFFAVLSLSGNASAAVPDTVKYKAAYEGVYQCYSKGAYNTSFMASSGGAGMLLKKLSGDTVKLPYGLTDASDNNANCQEILKGFKDNARSDDNLRAGLLQAGIWTSTNITTIKDYFAGSDGKGGRNTMGYTAEGTGNVENGQETSELSIGFNPNSLSSDKCRQKTGNTTTAGRMEFYNDSGQAYSDLIFPTVTKNNNGNWFTGDVASNSSGINVPEPGSGGDVSYHFCNNDSTILIQDVGSAKSPYYYIYVMFTEYQLGDFNTLTSNTIFNNEQEIVDATGKSGWHYNALTGLFQGTITDDIVEQISDFDDYKLKYPMNGTTEQVSSNFMITIAKLNATSAAGYNLGLKFGAKYDALKLSPAEIYSLYTYYVKDVFKYPVICDGDANFSLYNDSNAKKITWAKGKTCYIDTKSVAASPAHAVYGVDDKDHFTKKVTIDDVADRLASFGEDIFQTVTDAETGGSIPDGSTVPGTGNGNDNNDNNGGDEISCFTNAASLGWILCPVLQAAGATTQGLYSWIEKDWLSIGTDEVMAEQGKGVYDAWKTFRDFTNIIFAIIIILIIFSQVTGFGVSNYGVKKLLPIVIIIAVLVNISFFLCQLCVDVSNIAGESIKVIFTQMQVNINNDRVFDFGEAISNLFATVGVALAGAGGVVWGLEHPDVWMLPLLLVVITAIIAIIIFFITLAVRKAGIYILIVLSPLAIICYALPNTKKFFDRWLKMFSSLLLVYPICGLLMGGGSFAAKIMVSVDGGFVMDLVGVMLQVIPFFFIPSVLRSSMAAMGNIGTHLANFGNRLGKTITNGVAHSDAARRFNIGAAAWGAQTGAGLAGRMRNGLRRVPGLGRAYRAFDSSAAGRALAKNRRLQQAASIAKYNKMQQEDYLATKQPEQMIEGSDAYNNMIATIDRKYDAEQTENAMNSLINNPDYNHESLSNLESDLTRTLTAIDNSPEDKKLQYRAKAITDLMMKAGPNGQDALMRAVKGHAYDSEGRNGSRSVGNNTVLGHLGTDSRYRPAIKAGNYGDDKFITDYLGGNDIKNRAAYETMSKNSAQAMANGTDDFYTNMISRINGGDFNGRLGELNKIDEAATRALQDTKISGNIDNKVAGWLNDIRKGAYEARKQNFINQNIGEYMTNYNNAGRSRTEIERELGNEFERENPFRVINPALYVDRS